jgi:hypothetical protein
MDKDVKYYELYVINNYAKLLFFEDITKSGIKTSNK